MSKFRHHPCGACLLHDRGHCGGHGVERNAAHGPRGVCKGAVAALTEINVDGTCTDGHCCGNGVRRRHGSSQANHAWDRLGSGQGPCNGQGRWNGKGPCNGQRRGAGSGPHCLRRSLSDPALNNQSQVGSCRCPFSTQSQADQCSSAFLSSSSVSGSGPGPYEHRMGQQLRLDQQSDCKPRRVVMDYLFDHVDSIVREKEEIKDPGTGAVVGVRAVTTSDDEEVARAIQKHVQQMTEVKESGGSVRMWDHLFRAVAAHELDITMDVENIEGGVRAEQIGSTPYAAALVKAHANVVSKFVENGLNERPKAHEAPKECHFVAANADI